MDDLNQQISQFLSDPDSMRQLQSMMNTLGLGGSGQGAAGAPADPPPPPAPAPTPDLSALAGALSALGGANAHPAPQLPAVSQGADTIAMVTRLAPLLSQLNQEDDSTRLLKALRPMLSENRRQKIDEAVKILQLMRLLPLLRDMGGLPGLF